MAYGNYSIYLVVLILIGIGPLRSMWNNYHSSKWWDEHGRDKYEQRDRP